MDKFDIYKNRENIMWTNTWIEDCRTDNNERILIIGDSVAREFRSSISKFLSESIDFIGTSYSFEDPYFYNIFEAFFKNNLYKYSQIWVNIGFNHMNYLDTNNNFEHKIRFKTSFNNFLEYLKQYSYGIVILLGTPKVISENKKKFNELCNTETLSRNNIAREIAVERNFKVVDLYSHIISNQKIYKYKDAYHFKSKYSQQNIAKFIIKSLDKNILQDIKQNTIKNSLFTIKKNLERLYNNGQK